MIYLYLFEVKSIQSYLFRSGKLKDVISASERLDQLIDDNEASLLNKVLNRCQLTSDLLTANDDNNPSCIYFLRAKGGAFYAYAKSKEPLLRLRSLWTLSLPQLFPSLTCVDALVEASSLMTAVKLGHEQLASDRNSPSMKFPVATSIMAASPRTGQPAVPLSNTARYAAANENTLGNQTARLDVDIEQHRQAYINLDMAAGAALQHKFTPDDLTTVIHYPTNLDAGFKFSEAEVSQASKQQQAAIKDIALIHIDGNGLGVLLRSLQAQLQDASEAQYRAGFRAFSNALALATQQAAKSATYWLYEVAQYSYQGKTYVPMRPIIIGGDDVTLLCRADLAIEYSKHFCVAFKKYSQQALAPLFNDMLLGDQSGVKDYLTASGGILFHKASHPFTHSHHLVEGLCAQAKQLTKQLDSTIGPAALAFFRLSNAVAADIAILMRQAQSFTVEHEQVSCTMSVGQNCYLVEQENTLAPSFADLERCVRASSATMMSKWRQMATHLALGNKYEAALIYQRASELSDLTSLEAALKHIAPNTKVNQWYWQTSSGLQCIINDMLIVNHFSPVLATKTSQTDDCAMEACL